jgi:hypothetical protein
MNYSFNFEIKNLLTQFVAAFDNVVIKRYDKNREDKEDISVRYVLAPKQRVMYDIVNKAQNLTLPVAAIELTSVSRDNNRVFNKLSGFNNFRGPKRSTFIKTPVPVNLSIKMSILARYIQDIDQILSSFVQNTNPYIIITWSEPNKDDDSLDKTEIRTEILWDGNISLTSPTDTSFNDKFRIVADTAFTIKGWVFRDENTDDPLIYKITESFYSSPEFVDLLELDDYESFKQSLSGSLDLERITIGSPKITNVYFLNNIGKIYPIYSSPIITNTTNNTYMITGEYFTDTTSMMLSSNSTLLGSLTSIETRFETSNTSTVSGYIIPQDNINIIDNNVLTVNIPELNESGIFDIIVFNNIGWDTTATSLGLSFQSSV